MIPCGRMITTSIRFIRERTAKKGVNECSRKDGMQKTGNAMPAIRTTVMLVDLKTKGRGKLVCPLITLRRALLKRIIGVGRPLR